MESASGSARAITTQNLEGMEPATSVGEACRTDTCKLVNLVTQVRSLLDSDSTGREGTESIEDRLQRVDFESPEDFEFVLRVIFNNAVATHETNTFALHADMIYALRNQCPEFPRESEGQKPANRRFQRILWNTCQDEFENLHRAMVAKSHGREEHSSEDELQCVVTVHSAIRESGDWDLTCTTLNGTNLLPDLIMPKDYCYEDVRVMLAMVSGIPSFRVRLVSPAGTLLIDDQEDRLLALMKFFGNLFLRQLLINKIIGQVMHELIGIRNGLPTECEVSSACRLCEVIGSVMDSTTHGRKLMSQFCQRLIDLKFSFYPSGNSLLSDDIKSQIEDLLSLRRRDWR